VGADTAVSASSVNAQICASLQLSTSTAFLVAASPTLLKYRIRFEENNNVPLAGALSVGPRTRIPDRLVRHVGWLCVGLRCRCYTRNQYTDSS
jgi:hypothetical protein